MTTVTTKYHINSLPVNPVTKTMFPQKLFGQIFKISFQKRNVGSNRNLAVALMLLRTLDYADFMDSPLSVILTLRPGPMQAFKCIRCP